MYPEEEENGQGQGQKLDGSREGIDFIGEDGPDVIVVATSGGAVREGQHGDGCSRTNMFVFWMVE